MVPTAAVVYGTVKQTKRANISKISRKKKTLTLSLPQSIYMDFEKLEIKQLQTHGFVSFFFLIYNFNILLTLSFLLYCDVSREEDADSVSGVT